MVQEQLGAVLVEVADLRWASKELAGRLVEMTHLCDEAADWACGGVAMVLERAVEATIGLVRLTGLDLREQVLGLLA